MDSAESLDLDLQKLGLVIKRRWLIGAVVFLGMVGLTIPMALLQSQQTSYEAKGKLLFKVSRTADLTGVGQQVGELAPLTTNSNPITTEIEILRSVPLAKETIAALNLKSEDGTPLSPEALHEKLTIENLAETDVLELAYESSNPQEAAAVVNYLMNLYIKNNVKANRAEVVAAVKFLNEQLPKAEANVNQAEMALRQFKEVNKVVSLEEESRAAVDTLAKLDQQITEVKSQFKDANARSAELRDQVGMNSQEAIVASSLSQSPGVQQVLQEFQQVQSKLRVEQTRFQDEDPTIISLKEREAALRNLLQERVVQTIGVVRPVSASSLQMGDFRQELTLNLVNAEVERLGLASQLNELENVRLAYQQRLTILPKLEKDQRELQRRLDASQSTYEILLKKLQEVRVAENQNIGNARIIEPAEVPLLPSSQMVQTVLPVVGGGALGILLAIVTIITLEVRDTSIKTLREVRELFGYTLLGVIPSLTKKGISRSRDLEGTIPELPVRDTPRLPISEAYRMLQANLKFLSSDKTPRVIVVTSSVPKEGKSTVSANLAAAIAQLGRRVLLIDADLRHPLQHHIWDLTNTAGLSDVLVGQADFAATVRTGMDSLDVLTAGVIPPNPLALLDSKRMASLIDDFSKTYQFVIIDAPPLILAADALTLGNMTDGVLLVARPGVVDSTSAAAAKESLERAGQNILGLVANGVKQENQADKYPHYYEFKDSTSAAAPAQAKATSLS
ncbi:MAG TPA: lipopolysaccharide biosynthesis protein [Cyanobacteria bacterium UBA8803]|nr:lipopolysaccharide biosynthesis protein [Cyanobacteria bacterium UBA9273]HBL60869.1 lipopolysaccharide biosynthesis protein [Cyanobacteria bacterium UBA8803]